jgi:HSP20 family protein
MAETLPIKRTESIFDELNSLHDRVMRRAYDIFKHSDHIFGRDLDNWLRAEEELVWKPSIELEEKGDEFRIQMGVPGVEPKDIDIEVTPEDIIVKAEMRHEHKEDKGKVHVCEFASGNLFRAIHLPKRIDPNKVKAEFKNGILNLVAKVSEEARARKIEIGAA